MRNISKHIGSLAIAASLVVALPAFAQTTTGTTTGSTTPTTPNTGAGGSAALNLIVLTGSALVAVAGGAYLARSRFAR